MNSHTTLVQTIDLLTEGGEVITIEADTTDAPDTVAVFFTAKGAPPHVPAATAVVHLTYAEAQLLADALAATVRTSRCLL